MKKHVEWACLSSENFTYIFVSKNAHPMGVEYGE